MPQVVGCLCLSGLVVQGWWQGTLDAFGVGFAVGGVVDVIAISALNQSASQEQERREALLQAAEIIRGDDPLGEANQARRARDLLDRSGRQLLPDWRDALEALIERAKPPAQ